MTLDMKKLERSRWLDRACARAQAGEARIDEVVREGSFTRVRKAAATPFNMILEARP